MESVEIHDLDVQGVRANKQMLVERLADDLAHEIRNPLHSMVINLEVLRRRVSRWNGGDAEDLMRYVDVLSAELDRVSNRVDLLLRIVRTDGGSAPVRMADAVDELLEALELERERKGVTVETSPLPPTSLRPRLPRDPGRHILLNLLLFALDAATPGGSVTISWPSDEREEQLRIIARPAVAVAGPELPSGELERSMRTTIGALASSIGARLDICSLAADPTAGVELTLALPLEPVGKS